MSTNSDLTPSQNAGTTGNPQSVDTNLNTSDTNSFQTSVNPDSLEQNRSISVVDTGKPVQGKVAHGGSLATAWVLVIIVLIIVAGLVLKWVMKSPEFSKIEEPAPKPVAPVLTKQKAKKNKKVSRSGRKKK